jgi:hypothetical protein
LTPKKLLPKRVVDYIHEMGVRALDHLADHVQPSPTAAPPAEGEAQPTEGATPNAVATLVSHWQAMTDDEKEEFVDRVAASVIEVIAASAALPVGKKRGKRVVKATKRVLERETKKVRKLAKQARKQEKASEPAAAPKKTAKPKAAKPKAAKATPARKTAKRPAARRATKKTEPA